MRFLAFALMSLFVPVLAHAGDFAIPAAYPSVQNAAQDSGRHAWKRSLLPLIASQGLDAHSSWGMRELNPVLADRNGAFGMKAAGVKFGVVGALIGIEYLIVKKFPNSARVFSKMNWGGAILTTGFAVHNYSIR